MGHPCDIPLPEAPARHLRARRTAGVLPLLACLASLLVLPAAPSRAQQPKSPGTGAPAASAADKIADFFSHVGDQIYEEDCIFELSEEQVEVQHALIQAYIKAGASSPVARQFAVKQIQPPKLSAKCEQMKGQPQAAAPGPGPAPLPWETTLSVEKKKQVAAAPKLPPEPPALAPSVVLATKKMLPQWDCGADVDFVSIHLNGYERKLTGGEICNPYEDVVHEVPAAAPSFRLGYTIRTGRLFVVSDDPQVSGKTIAWAISGRDACRNNPDPDCLAARALGPLPPGEYAFSAEQERRVSWGPKTKRNVAGIWLRKLWNKDRFTRPQVAAMLARGNIAIHVRLKGEMSEACIGLEPKGWAYVGALIKDGRATGINVYIDEPYPQVAEAPPVVVGSSFSLTSLFQ